MGDAKPKAAAPSGVWGTVKPFVNGGASGMLATCVIQPIDMVKVRIQLGQGSATHVAKTMLAQDGFGSFYKVMASDGNESPRRMDGEGREHIPTMEHFMKAVWRTMMQSSQDKELVGESSAKGESINWVDRFLRLNPPTFVGRPDPNIAEFWMGAIEKAFDALSCPEEEKTALAVYVLKDNADAWWRLQRKTIFQGKAIREITWAEFVQAFEDKYLPVHLKLKKEAEFMHLVQGRMSVHEYEMKFVELGKFAPHILEDERRTTQKFIDGLNQELRTLVVPMCCKTLEATVETASAVETEYARIMREGRTMPSIFMRNRSFGADRTRSFTAPSSSKGKKFFRNDSNKGTSGFRAPSTASTATTFNRNQSMSYGSGRNQSMSYGSGRQPCSQCGRMHGGKECYFASGKCFNCGQQGHLARDCPRPRGESSEDAKRQKTQGRVFALTKTEAQASNLVEGFKQNLLTHDDDLETSPPKLAEK